MWQSQLLGLMRDEQDKTLGCKELDAAERPLQRVARGQRPLHGAAWDGRESCALECGLGSATKIPRTAEQTMIRIQPHAVSFLSCHTEGQRGMKMSRREF